MLVHRKHIKFRILPKRSLIPKIIMFEVVYKLKINSPPHFLDFGGLVDNSSIMLIYTYIAT